VNPSARGPATAPPAAAERGATRIADRVVAKIASQAAQEALRELPNQSLVPRGTFPQASVTVRSAPRVPDGPRGRARVQLFLRLGYPVDLPRVCAAVRRRVVERVGELADMTVPEVSIEVERLHSATMASDQGRVR
jgi:uncharacterized alkaline shock family protein YloU